MVGRPRTGLIRAAAVLYTAIHVTLALLHADRALSEELYLVAVLLVAAAAVAILKWPNGRLATVWAPLVAGTTILGCLLVLSVLPDGHPSYALWYPSLIPIPLGGIALRGHYRLAVGSALVLAVATITWTAIHEPGGAAEGLYRTGTPTAAVVISVGVSVLMSRARRDVQRSVDAQLAARRRMAAVAARSLERRSRLSDVTSTAEPALRRLAAGETVDQRLHREAGLLEAALRDGIRGRRLADATVADAARAARSRGVAVLLLDDGPADEAGQEVVAARYVLAEVLERVRTGTVTARLAPAPGGGQVTVVVRAPDAAEVVAALTGPQVEVEVVSEDEVIVTMPGCAGPGTAAQARPGTGTVTD